MSLISPSYPGLATLVICRAGLLFVLVGVRRMMVTRQSSPTIRTCLCFPFFAAPRGAASTEEGARAILRHRGVDSRHPVDDGPESWPLGSYPLDLLRV
jgi:hypothetical protein